MMLRLGLALIVVAAAACAPKLPADTSAGGEDGAGGDTGTWGDDGTGGGESNDDTTAPFLGARGVVIFEPVPESWDEAILDLRLYGDEIDVADDTAESFGHYREFVSESPAPFSIPLHPTKYDPDTYRYYVTGFVDWNGDGKEGCEEHWVSHEYVDPADGVPVTLYARPNDWECPESSPCYGMPVPEPAFPPRLSERAVYVGDTLQVELEWYDELVGRWGYGFELAPEDQVPGTHVLTVEYYCDPGELGSCVDESVFYEVETDVVSLDDSCLAARFVELVEGGCVEVRCRGFVVEIE
jgi:hypothetical protein